MGKNERALNRWEFEKQEDGTYRYRYDGIEIVWNDYYEIGVYTFEGELTYIPDFEHLDDLMSLTNPLY